MRLLERILCCDSQCLKEFGADLEWRGESPVARGRTSGPLLRHTAPPHTQSWLSSLPTPKLIQLICSLILPCTRPAYLNEASLQHRLLSFTVGCGEPLSFYILRILSSFVLLHCILPNNSTGSAPTLINLNLVYLNLPNGDIHFLAQQFYYV